MVYTILQRNLLFKQCIEKNLIFYKYFQVNLNFLEHSNICKSFMLLCSGRAIPHNKYIYPNEISVNEVNYSTKILSIDAFITVRH